MQTIPPELETALAAMRAGDLTAARHRAQTAHAAKPGDPAIAAFLGMLHLHANAPADAIPHLRVALTQWPDDAATRGNLAGALLAVGAWREALEVAGVADGNPRLFRVCGFAHQALGEEAAAARAFARVVAVFPDDFESWNNLGNARASLGDAEGAREALRRAVALRPDLPMVSLNLSRMLTEEKHAAERAAIMRRAASIVPDDANMLMELGLAEAGVGGYPAAEQAYRAAITGDPATPGVWLELGLMLENLNRLDDLDQLIAEAREHGVADPAIDFLQAWAHRRAGRLEEALALADAAPETISPVRRWQLIAEVNDRLGRSANAFAAFAAMNAAAADASPDGATGGFCDDVIAAAALMTPARVADWSVAPVAPTPPSPVFIVGFPRSGTTLLDTLLMNLPDVHVMEELPVMRQVEALVPNALAIATLSEDDVRQLRARYFEALAIIAPPPAGATIIDKYPLHMARIPLIHRIFPDARIVLCERHPCDVVLSCFMANFKLNRAMRSFGTIERAAALYDAVFDSWTRSEELLPINVHRVRYERMIESIESEMRDLLGFLDIPWDDKVLDNQASANQRGHIRTASYAQVGQPIYRHAVERWRRYQTEMSDVLPLLTPWAARMGYGV